MSPPEQVLSAVEERFEALRKRIGFALAPIAGIVLWFMPIAALKPEAHHLLAILGVVVTLWVSEAIPLAATALLGPALCIVTGIGSAKEVLKGFADPIIFMFLGSFLIAEAMLHHGLNRRIAFKILGLKSVGESPLRLLTAFSAVTGFLSMWISNTATTAMMFPIAAAILAEMARMQSRRSGREVHFTSLRYGTALMLSASFASSVGGLATPIGTPPNLIGLSQIKSQLGIQIPFFHWMMFGLPLAVALVAFIAFYLGRACPAEPGLLRDSAEWLQSERAKLGRLSAGERNVLIAFTLAIIGWTYPGIVALVSGMEAPHFKLLNQRLPEAAVSLLAGLLLFLLPVNLAKSEFTLSWDNAKRVDWGTILLFGGGLALGDLMFSTGLAKWIGTGLAEMVNAHSSFGLVVLFTLVSVAVSETTSNAASATMVVPVAIVVAQAAGVDPFPPALAACLGASLGFMLPVSTPPNAIVYGSGCVPLARMIRYGLLLDIVGAVLIIAVVGWLVPLIR